MAWYNLITICLSIIAIAISLLTFFFSSRPHIKIEIDDCVHSVPSELVCIMFRFSNKSPIAGDIKYATLSFVGYKFQNVERFENFDFSKISLFKTNGARFDLSKISNTLPVTAIPFSYNTGMIVFNTKGIVFPICKATLKINFVSGLRFKKSLVLDILRNSSDNVCEDQTRFKNQ